MMKGFIRQQVIKLRRNAALTCQPLRIGEGDARTSLVAPHNSTGNKQFAESIVKKSARTN